jgi:alpha-ketoglutarate-dependent taurine dioxygenase
MTVGTMNLVHSPIDPFGMLVRPAGDGTDGADVRSLPPEQLARWVDDARVLVLRGFAPLDRDEFVAFCRGWGEILTWDFGEVLDLVVHETPKNYLFTPGVVPYHWDGAFARAEPNYMIFQCVQAPEAGSGGQTVFCDTTKVCRRTDDARLEQWRRQPITYQTEKVEHYGGHVTQPLVSTHPKTGAARIRYAEPLAPEDYLNPLFIDVEGVDEEGQERLVDELREVLYAPEVCYPHEWHDGDIVVADNFAVLHGRRPFTHESPRHLRRVHVL